MYTNTKSRSLQRLSSHQGKWISFQLKLKNITHDDVAEKAGCSRPSVTNVLAGRYTSSRVYEALCNILGCSMSELLRRGEL